MMDFIAFTTSHFNRKYKKFELRSKDLSSLRFILVDEDRNLGKR